MKTALIILAIVFVLIWAIVATGAKSAREIEKRYRRESKKK